MPQPLSGIRVLDLTRMIAGPSCTQILGDLGADVIKVERPGLGDDMRGYGPPFLKAADGSDDDSPYHLAVNRNKRSITANVASDEGAELIRKLAVQCDIFVENYKVGDLKRRGLDYESIRKVNPDIIYCSVTGFGQTGPSAHRPGLDSLFQATTGLMSITGEPDGRPQKVGTPTSDITAGLYATVGILSALRHREQNGGGGQHVDIALLDCQIAALSNRGQQYLISGQIPTRHGAGTPGNVPASDFHCKDGELMISAGSEPQFRNFARLMGKPEWGEDPRYKTRQLRVVNQKALTQEMEAILMTKTRAEWLEIFQENGVMCAPINNIGEAFAEPQVKHRQMVVPVPHPTAGEVPLIANPIKFSETPFPTYKTPPRLGADTEAILGDLLGLKSEELAGLRERGAI